MAGKQHKDDYLDDADILDGDDDIDLGFISSQKNTRRGVRKNIEEMLEARELRRSMQDIFDDDF
ncbi:PA3496 family putative envelope integrity protein [Neptunomonas phycophila]|uniref:PA3496 family putative envelope integrity protein n=1 Tax=Neptunomonas phycophila TaxID=1572645 RepID=UPI001BEA8383|nr:hypothetical protein [Neptunomonas phycophila]MBT3147206.1 hypothetical protein [Neptunomonas phycophila]